MGQIYRLKISLVSWVRNGLDLGNFNVLEVDNLFSFFSLSRAQDQQWLQRQFPLVKWWKIKTLHILPGINFQKSAAGVVCIWKPWTEECGEGPMRRTDKQWTKTVWETPPATDAKVRPVRTREKAKTQSLCTPFSFASLRKSRSRVLRHGRATIQGIKSNRHGRPSFPESWLHSLR